LTRGDVWQQRGDLENIFLQLAPEGNWTITTKVNLNTTENFEQAFLAVWQDSNNFLMIKKAYIDGQRFTATLEVDGIYQDVNIHTNFIGDTVYLKIEKTSSNTYRCYYSGNSTVWINIGGTITADFNETKIGIGGTLVDSGRSGVIAQFDFFNIDRANSLADINTDGSVNLLDFAPISSDYANANSIIRLTGDINEDGICNIFDYIILAEDWLE